jgi:hypothetical protein
MQHQGNPNLSHKADPTVDAKRHLSSLGYGQGDTRLVSSLEGAPTLVCLYTSDAEGNA